MVAGCGVVSQHIHRLGREFEQDTAGVAHVQRVVEVAVLHVRDPHVVAAGQLLAPLVEPFLAVDAEGHVVDGAGSFPAELGFAVEDIDDAAAGFVPDPVVFLPAALEAERF